MADPPTNIRALQAEQVFELTWPDSRVDALPYGYVRGHCPCAVCVDEHTGVRRFDESQVASTIRLEGMEPVGNYAVRLSWNDGHSSGLFTWEMLRNFSASPDP